MKKKKEKERARAPDEKMRLPAGILFSTTLPFEIDPLAHKYLKPMTGIGDYQFVLFRTVALISCFPDLE